MAMTKEFEGLDKVMIDFSYVGRDLHGLAYQKDEDTVEGRLFDALDKVNMLKDLVSSRYERAARTDKGVHALHNYCSFFVDPGFVLSLPDHLHRFYEFLKPSLVKFETDEERNLFRQTRISGMTRPINKHLPKYIRVNSIAIVPPNFSARGDCTYRIYKYYFQPENMDIYLMREACQYFVGHHNFTQFCKTDKRNPKDPNKTIYFFGIEKYNDLLHAAVIKGSSFLWHQVRCMMAVLFLVGKGTINAVEIKNMLERHDEEKMKFV
ncbi:tRNA pseudouridine synthase A, putative [Theileria equi strain WA]|uniref:tRNA pseudouridine synthase n=1 Tax=Theileria equi strain WA TaxID=1537102 RepID=L1L9Z2_THEEQ|nr:tRNA pseudouridine synthase A, putative [Theileria equi strain WA]EKX72069.1 tRNA pseudouridine synthase A, putative [Theileria equi strain WA]|eukprot:XP_004831521.1 tRNA pseudouridine synthase A, putative [Theileria equi strain WA]